MLGGGGEKVKEHHAKDLGLHLNSNKKSSHRSETKTLISLLIKLQTISTHYL